jgi:chitin disaccharide deacetylase
MASMTSMTSAKRAGTIVALALSAVGITGQGPTLQERLGHPVDARLLVIHADDLGMSHSVNRATFEAFENGWITSASILVPCPWFPEVARWARAHPDADLGIHLAVNSEWTGFRWGPLSPRDAVASLLDKDGYFPLLETDVVDHAKPADIDRELRAQINRARDAGVKLTHLDSHMATMFRTPEFFDVYRKLGAAYDLPVLMERLGDRGGEQSPWATAAQGDALIDRVVSIPQGVAKADWPQAYEKMLAPLPPGVYQLIVHLGYDDEEMRGATFDHPDWGAAWRQNDLELVKSARFRDFLRQQKFVLIGWKDLARAKP